VLGIHMDQDLLQTHSNGFGSIKIPGRIIFKIARNLSPYVRN
jgi:hypothetical protein